MNRKTRTERTEKSHHGMASDHSSMESDERCHGGVKDDSRQHTKHRSRGDKHAADVAHSEKRRSEKHSSNGSSSTKDRSDQAHRGEAKNRHSEQTSNVTLNAESRKHEQETDSRKKRKRDDSCEVDRSSGSSTLNSSAHRANSDDGDLTQKQAKTESGQTAAQSRTAKQTVGTAYEDAVARYLARKGKSGAPVVCEDSE